MSEDFKIIAVTGKKRHGKSTVQAVLDAYFDLDPLNFADPVKAVTRELFDWSAYQVSGRNEDREKIDPFWGFSIRHALQYIGTEVARQLHPDVWVRHMDRRCAEVQSRDLPGVAIGDLRFDNEAEWAHTAGEVWLVYRPLDHEDHDTHASEAGVSPLYVDRYILNDGTERQLEHSVTTLMHYPEITFIRCSDGLTRRGDSGRVRARAVISELQGNPALNQAGEDLP